MELVTVADIVTAGAVVVTAVAVAVTAVAYQNMYMIVDVYRCIGVLLM